MSVSSATGNREKAEIWPTLPFEAWKETRETLHMWSQVVGKVRLALSPHLNHWWQVPLYVTARGLTTSPIPYKERLFEVHFDFIDHNLFVSTTDGAIKAMPLIPRSVAEFYREFMAVLDSLDIQVKINPLPSEVMNPIRCDEDYLHTSYDPEYVNRFWRILVQSDRIFKKFSSPFTGKISPVHFFWGSFDLAVTRFSGKPAPERPGASRIMREAYSHEVISFGFWPGDANFKEAAYYSYTAPEPPGLKTAAIRPRAAFYSPEMGEFFLRYEDVRKAVKPEELILDFLQSAYDAGADLAHWDRASLERSL